MWACCGTCKTAAIRWKKNGWRTADKKPVKNVDLWQALDEAIRRHEIEWRWVKGHAGNEMNDRADELAREAIKAMREGKKTAGGNAAA